MTVDVTKIEQDAATVGERVAGKIHLAREFVDHARTTIEGLDSGFVGTLAKHLPFLATIHDTVLAVVDGLDLGIDVLDDMVQLGKLDLESIANPGHLAAPPQAGA